MFRRNFLKRLSLSGTAVLSAASIAKTSRFSTVHYRVKGFSCPACAVGLDTLLRRQPGVTGSMSTYPQGTVVIEFDSGIVTEKALAAFITDQGFAVVGRLAS